MNVTEFRRSLAPRHPINVWRWLQVWSLAARTVATALLLSLLACSNDGPSATDADRVEAGQQHDKLFELAENRVSLCKSVVAHYGGKHTVSRVDQGIKNDGDNLRSNAPYERIALTLAMQNALGTPMKGSASCDYLQTQEGIAHKPFRITIGKTVHADPASVAEMITLPDDFGLGKFEHDH